MARLLGRTGSAMSQGSSAFRKSAPFPSLADRRTRHMRRVMTTGAPALASGGLCTPDSPLASEVACKPEAHAARHERVAIFVEPSPFSHVSGMKNRFECLIKGLREAGDEVTVYTPDAAPPAEFFGAKVCMHANTKRNACG